MTPSEACAEARGYARGREDAGETGTVKPHLMSPMPGSFYFSQAYARQQDEFNHGTTTVMPAVASAYSCWQASGGRSVIPAVNRERTRP